MNKINFFSMTLLSAALVACGGGSGSPDKPDLCGDLGLKNCDQFTQPSSASSSSIAPPINNILPLNESFTASNATAFFHYSYKSLLNPNSEDPNNAFYYSTSGLDSGRLLVGDGKMTIGNARFTIGQRLQTTGTHLNPNPTIPYADYKVNTTTAGDATGFPTTTTWGELDLTNPWKISFCVREFAKLEGAANNQQFMVYVDNNQSASGASIHGTNSLTKEVSLDLFEAGKRVEITFPGEVRVGGVFKTFVTENVGRTTSFIQLRVPSAGVITMSDLWIGYQANTTSEPAASTCTTGTRLPNWGVPMPPVAPVAPTFEPGNNQLRVTWPVASLATNYVVAYNTVDSVEGATLLGAGDVKITGTSTVITGLQNGTSYYVFVKAINAGGESAFGPSAIGVPEIPATPPETPTGLTVYGDSQRALVTWAATDGAENYSLALNTMNSATGATETTGITDTFKRLTGLVDNTPYYVFVKAGNAVGDSVYTAAQVVTPSKSPYIYEANFDVTKDLFFGTNGPAVQTLGVNSEIPLHFIAGGGTGITIEEGGIRLASGGRFTIGQVLAPNSEGVLGQLAATTMNDTTVNGLLDLSGYYKIVISVVTAADAGSFQVYLDNNTTSGSNSIHNTPKTSTNTRSRLLNQTASGIVDGQEIVIDVSADRRGTTTSFIQLRVDSGVGTEGILISGVRIEEIDPPVGGSSSEASSSAPASSSSSSSSSDAGSSVAPSSSAPSSVAESSSSASSVAGGVSSSDSSSSSSSAALVWTDNTLDLFGSAVATAPVGSAITQNNGGTVIQNATGGTMTASSAFRTFFTNIPATGEFVFTARLASVTAKDGTAFTGPGNSYGFGIMVIQDKPTSVASYANVPAFATINLYSTAAGSTPTFVGSRAHKLDSASGTRSRSDATGVAVGSYLRIEVFQDGANYRVRRFISSNNITYTELNSSSWAGTTSQNWFVGPFAAPGAEELVITYDNISLTPYVAPVIP